MFFLVSSLLNAIIFGKNNLKLYGLVVMLLREAWKIKTRSLFNHNNNLVILLVLLQSLVNLHGLYCL